MEYAQSPRNLGHQKVTMTSWGESSLRNLCVSPASLMQTNVGEFASRSARFGWNAGKSQPTRGGSITEELLRERSGLQRQDSTMSAFSFTSDEWSMAPEVVSTFQSGHVEDISNENVLNERWRRLSFVRVYMRKFCLFGGWAAARQKGRRVGALAVGEVGGELCFSG
ncbi:unnamed protein product [Durusdinium trenchii]|uniref:Uncharacterized protein n=1 Tax=Durusdinium trenchii TaxID=1381693 RepID=A0ABP0QTU1_9DINO